MLLGERWERLDAFHGSNMTEPEWADDVVFLHKIIEGAADKSYGIHVARLAGIPKPVLERAKEILAQLENEHLDAQGHARIARKPNTRANGRLQLTLFGPMEHPLLEEIRQLDLNTATPLEAMRLIQQWQERLTSETTAATR